MSKRVRRTKEEIAAGITVAQKKDMVEQALIKNRGAVKTAQPAAKTSTDHEQYDPDTKTVYKYKTKVVKEEVIKEVPVIKEVRILNGTKGTEKTVQEILNKELDRCVWEWKELKMDKNFTVKQMKDLGKQGWRMTHIMEWRYIKDDWKKKPDSMFFQKPRK